MSIPGNSMREVTIDYASNPSVNVTYVNVPGWSYSGASINQTQPIASGLYSVAGGSQSRATGNYSTAIGENAEATGTKALAIGTTARALGDSAIALGPQSQADSNGIGGIAVGWNCKSSANAIALGTGIGSVQSQFDVGGGSAHVGISTDDDDTVAMGTCVGIDCVTKAGTAIGKRIEVESSDGTALAIGRDLIVRGIGATSFGADFINAVSEEKFFMCGITTPMLGTGTSTGFTRKHVMNWAYIDYPAGPTALTEFEFGSSTILRNNSGVACTVTAPTASLVRNRYPSARVGDYIDLWMQNSTPAVNMTLTLGAGSGYDTASYVLAGSSAVCLRFIWTDVTVGASTLSLAYKPFPSVAY